MKTPYAHVMATAALLFGFDTAQAQYIFKSVPDAGIGSGGLSSYQQNFNGLSGKNSVFTNNQTLRGVYAGFTLDGTGSAEYPTSIRTTYNPATGALTGVYYDRPIGPDDGSRGSSANSDGGAGWYHFGSASVDPADRALGGIASTTTDSGVGHIGIRLQNSSGTLIKNLEIIYAMEQWYNSGKVDQAQVRVAYRKVPATASAAAKESLVSGTWTNIADLGVDAPSTGMVIASSDGNSAANRRVLRAKLMGGAAPSQPFGAGLAPGEEIMIRWSYVFNSATNGNGLSLDDVTITPETNIFYSATTGNLNNKNTWGINTNGSGTRPDNFNLDNTIFYVLGNTPLTSRLPNSSGSAWTIGGANSKVVVGTAAQPANLYLEAADGSISGTVDVASGSVLQIEKPVSGLTLGSVGSNSVVEYINTSTTEQTVSGGSYGNLKLTGSGPKKLAGPIIVSNAVTFNSAGLSALSLLNYDCTVLKTGRVVAATGQGYFVTNGTGGLRQTVPATGQEITFPVAVTADVADYTPVVLSQQAANSEDTYKVRVGNNVYRSYDAHENGSSPVTEGVVKKTWFISEEVPGNSDITLQTFWNTKDEAPSFQADNAYIDHYSMGRSWDRVKETPGSIPKGNQKGAKKGGVKKFSPFAVTSQVGGVLPVELVAFAAKRTSGNVRVTWATAGEKNNAHFLVERSLSGSVFQEVGKVLGQGTSSQAHAYSFVDKQPASALSYYRLRQVDSDGQEAFSPTVAVKGCPECVGGSPIISITPNPGSGRFELWTGFAEAISLQTTVLNVVGSPVLSQDVQVKAGPQRTLLDLSAQPAGVYLVRVVSPSGPQTLRVVKQ